MNRSLKFIGGVAIALIILFILSPSVAWDGGTNVNITIAVIDNQTDSPIENAVIFLGDQAISRFPYIRPEERDDLIRHHAIQGVAATDKDGICTVSKTCGAGGGSFFFILTGNYNLSGPLKIQAAGYKEINGLIQNFIGKKRFSLSEKNHRLTVYLEKQPQ